jgi:hypothetical protein
MWDPRLLTILWVSTACYRDSFTLYLLLDSFNRNIIYDVFLEYQDPNLAPYYKDVNSNNNNPFQFGSYLFTKEYTFISRLNDHTGAVCCDLCAATHFGYS